MGLLLAVTCVSAAHAADLAPQKTDNLNTLESGEISSQINDEELLRRTSRILTRGEAVDNIVVSFDLKATKKAYIAECLANAQECFFVFAAMSDFDDIAFEPLKLYPDLYENLRYYDSIMTASALGLVHGYLEDEGTPFKPEVAITRIQALKIVLAAADLLRWKEKFEIEDLPVEDCFFSDVDGDNPNMWWYPRYINFAVEAGIVETAIPLSADGLTPDPTAELVSDELLMEPDRGSLFRPDDTITVGELTDFIDKTKLYIENGLHDPQILTHGNPA